MRVRVTKGNTGSGATVGEANAFAWGDPSVFVEFDSLEAGWYGVQVISWSGVDYDYNLLVYS